MVNPQVGNKVEEENGRNTNLLGSKVQSSSHKSKTDIGDEDEDGLVGAENSAGRLEVTDSEPLGKASLGLPLLAALAGASVEEEIRLPSEKLVEDELDHLSSGGILNKLSDVDASNHERLGRLGLSLGDESHVEIHVAGEAVVAVVRVLPAEVGDEEERVEEPAGHIVDLSMEGESTVAALMAENPDTGAEETLDEAVDHPCCDAEGLVGNAGDVGESCPDEGRDHGKIAEDVVE